MRMSNWLFLIPRQENENVLELQCAYMKNKKREILACRALKIRICRR